MNITQTEMVNHFKEIQAKSQSDYEESLRNLIAQVAFTDNGKTFLRGIVEKVGVELSFDLEKVMSEVEPPKAPQAPAYDKKELFKALKTTVPNLETEAEMELLMTAMDALRLAFNLYLGGDPKADAARDGLLQIFEAIRQAKVAHGKEGFDIPNVSGKFTKPPEGVEVVDLVAQELLKELGAISSGGDLQDWYESAKKKIVNIQDSKTRNMVYSAIRSRKLELA